MDQRLFFVFLLLTSYLDISLILTVWLVWYARYIILFI